MNLRKYFWAMRALIYKFRFGKCGIFNYIGKTTNISNHAKNIRLGNKVRIYPGLRAEIVDDQGKITIGDDVSIGQNLQITSYHGNLTIGNHVTIAGNVLNSFIDKFEFEKYDRVFTHGHLTFYRNIESVNKVGLKDFRCKAIPNYKKGLSNKETYGFDEWYFMYVEDADLCKRINQVSQLKYYPYTSVIHLWGKESQKNLKLLKWHMQAMIRYFVKWGLK